MQQIIEKFNVYFVQYGLNFAAALLIFLIGRWAASIISRITGMAMHKAKISDTLVSFSKHTVYFGVVVFVAIAALNKIGIETSSFVAIVGAAGLAVGLALQGSLANFAAGVMIILFSPFEVGDVVEAGGATGIVKEIQIFSTIITSHDDKRIIVPNAKITSDKITVMSRKQ